MDLRNNDTDRGPTATADVGGAGDTASVSTPHDKHLLEDVYRRHKRKIVQMLRKHVGSDDAAENLFQEACRITLERLLAKGIADSARLAGFIYGTARRLAHADRRRFANSRTDADQAILENIPDPGVDASVTSETEELASAVRRLLRELTVERDRHLLVRLYLDERDKDEVCAELGLSDEHFSRVLFRAKLRFRSILERHGLDNIGSIIGLLVVACGILSLSAH